MTQSEYRERIDLALKTTGNDSESWDGNFLINLALNGLRLIPTLGKKPPHWWMLTAPTPHIKDSWPDSYIVPGDFVDTRDAFLRSLIP